MSRRIESDLKPVIVGAVASTMLLGLAVYLQHEAPTALAVPPAVLALAALPLLAGLFVGGYITSFKGLGIEIEGKLDEPVSPEPSGTAGYDPYELEEKSLDELLDSEEVFQKMSVYSLEQLPEESRRSVRRLSFVNGRGGYAEWAVKEYLRLLPGLRYIEVTEEDGGLLGVIPIATFQTQDLVRFCSALKAGHIESTFRGALVQDTVPEGLALRDAVKRFQETGADFLPVTSGSRLVGILNRGDVEREVGRAVMGQVLG